VPVRTRSTFPLVPRHRVAGLPFGGAASLRRGHGSDVAGSRPYVRGDPISTIDWRASARLSTARGRHEFVVRERYAEEAPRVVVFADWRPSMGVYGQPFPWLSKPAAARSAIELIVESAAAASASVAYLDYAGAASRAFEPFWLAPGSHAVWERIESRLAEIVAYDAPEDGLERGLDFLPRFRAELSSGTFAFVISDFLGGVPQDAAWLTTAARRWEIVPVVVQDAVWEQSFPLVGPIVLPLADPRDGRVVEVRLSRREARARRESNAQRRDRLLARFVELGLDPVLLDTSDDEEVDRRFLAWADGRRDLRNRR
jgi:uncharacterized protein (DUF58 family)